MSSNNILRLIIDRPLPGAENMAIDEAILEAVGIEQAPPTLRFYQWNEPTISLGYFQKMADWQNQDDAIRQLALVRRKTGGGAILHDDELTYSLTLPLHQGLPLGDKITDMYKLVHDATITLLEKQGASPIYRQENERCHSQRGPFFCFARKHCLDLIAGEDKLMGSAQRRTKKACLQHGSLILDRHFSQQPSSALTKLTGKKLDIPTFANDVAEIIADKLHLPVAQGELSEQEIAAVKPLAEKYLSQEWTCQR